MNSLPNPFYTGVSCAPVAAASSPPVPTGDAAADRFVLDVDAFMNDIEPLPAFIRAPSQAYLRAAEIQPLLATIARATA